ncbi:hypothetical protein [Nitratifractor sp.]
MSVDLSVEKILQLHRKAQEQKEDLYNFLRREFPDISPEERLQYLSAILNDHFEAYDYDPKDEIRVDGYIVKRFLPKGEHDAKGE